MANSFGIPNEIEIELRVRDQNCVYCHKAMIAPASGGRREDWATIEHLNSDGPFYWKDGLRKEELAICCGACNSSRGRKALTDWFRGPYCAQRHINEATVAEPVKRALPEIHWTQAVTYPDAPHEYILRGRYPHVFEAYGQLIQAEGVNCPFSLRGKTDVYRYYFAPEGFQYWIIGDVLNRSPKPR
jgi:hypothetical protein